MKAAIRRVRNITQLMHFSRREFPMLNTNGGRHTTSHLKLFVRHGRAYAGNCHRPIAQSQLCCLGNNGTIDTPGERDQTAAIICQRCDELFGLIDHVRHWCGLLT